MYFKGCSLLLSNFTTRKKNKTKKKTEIKKPAVIGQIHVSQQGKASKVNKQNKHYLMRHKRLC